MTMKKLIVFLILCRPAPRDTRYQRMPSRLSPSAATNSGPT